jgi:hypothetical protein
MTANKAIKKTAALLEHLGIVGWTVLVEDLGDRSPVTGLRLFGTRRTAAKQIVISTRYLDDDAETMRTILHETAHAVLADDHGSAFRWALAHVRKLNPQAAE